ncbi:DUF664 domain-containing protein [Pseudonocardia halophobica]|uniref:mycothiol transferase n=1 Tax=Pseudonocardia halophobica TaxID=29401 RepID=UPI003D911685
MTEETLTLDPERTALLAELATARAALVTTTRDLTDEQAGARPTASALCLGGLIKHVASVGEGWMRFVVEGPSAMTYDLPEAPWNEPGGVRSARQVLVHVIAETAQHTGHADILRESIDGRTAS